jgi:TPR repeat protein
LLLSGLPAGSTISAGLPFGADNWLLSASELSNATIRPPRGFVGAIDLAVELRLADDTVADHLSLSLTWVETPKTTTTIAAAQTTAVAAPAGTGSTDNRPRETPNSQATNVPLRRLDREEIADLLKRGEEFVAAGNLGPARLALRRAAEAGDPQAAFVLATTYDPILLETRRVIGVVPDIAMARAWYEKAKEFGSTDASLRLGLLASRDR